MEIEAPLQRRKGGGRPPKFTEPSRPVTVTLPERTLADLERIDKDRGRAIVKLTDSVLHSEDQAPPPVEVVEMLARTGLVVIGPSQALRRIPFLHLVEIAPARFLLAMDPGHDFRNLEVAIQDLLDDVPADERAERDLSTSLLERIREIRRNDRVSMAEILFVRLAH